MEGNIALVLNVIAFVGMQLVWFEADQTNVYGSGAVTAMGRTYFGLLVANVLLTAAVALRDSPTSGLLRATGTFFLLQNIENAICSVPSVALLNSGGNIQRRDVSYAGSVLVLIAVFASLVASYTKGFKGPAAGAAGRVLSIRGIAFLLAAVFFLIASAIQWAWTAQCNASGRQAIMQWYPVTNAVLIVIAFIFVIAVVYGDNDAQNISVFLAAAYLFSGMADPIFDDKVEWADRTTGDVSFFKRWRTAKGLSFIGLVLLLLSAFITGKRGKLLPSTSALPHDLIAFAFTVAGAVSVWSRNPNPENVLSLNEQYSKAWKDYTVAFAVVITVINLLQGLLGLDAGQLITTFFAAFTLRTYDMGSLYTETGYVRGGLQLCQVGVLLSIFLKAFPADKPLLSYVKVDDNIANGFGLLWLLLAMLYVPSGLTFGTPSITGTGYSFYLLLAIITYRALSTGCADWGRTTFYILSALGVAGTFPLNKDMNTNYIASAFWVASCFYVARFSASGASTSPALNLPESLVADVAAAAVEMKANEPSEEAAATA